MTEDQIELANQRLLLEQKQAQALYEQLEADRARAALESHVVRENDCGYEVTPMDVFVSVPGLGRALFVGTEQQCQDFALVMNMARARV